MDSSAPFVSSPISPRVGRRARKSKFTFKQLAQLALSSVTTPLRVIAHVDLDAFYAQCEMVRLGVHEDQPLAVQQWQGLIAVNYPARNFGVGRFLNIPEAKKLCPDLIMQHVATWKEGDEKWAYHEDAYKHIQTHKVSLDPYRKESRKIFATIKKSIPLQLQRIEKAGIDEVFLDLSAQIHSLLLERYPDLRGPPPYDDPTELLPAPPSTALDWHADAMVDLDTNQSEEDDPDWDDVAMQIGSEIIRNLRAAIKDELKYTCSAGIARNKMLAKLGSGYKKPNMQTVVRNRAISQFLSTFKFTKIRNLGGKLGDEIVEMFETDTVLDLLNVPMDQLKRLGDDRGTWVYNAIRGQEHSEVSDRTQIKSMLSAKSFQPSINTFESAARWLRIFVADIFSRLVEEGVLENKRRPKTMNLHHRQAGQTRSKQVPIPGGKPISEVMLFELAKNLMAQVIVDGRAWPCANLSLSVAGFEDGPIGNRGIDGFLIHGEEAKSVKMENTHDEPLLDPSVKRRKTNGGKLQSFFKKQDSADSDAPPSERSVETNLEGRSWAEPEASTTQKSLRQRGVDEYFCVRCNSSMPEQLAAEHEDWHFAKDLQDGETQPLAARPQEPQAPESLPKKSKGRNLTKTEKGQRRLAF